MKKWTKLLACTLACCLIALNACPSVLAAEDAPIVLKVAFPETAGINEVYPDGAYGGSVYDWLQEIAKYTGWEYEFITGDPNELVDGMAAGEYDLMGGAYYLEELKETYNYSKYNMGFNYSLLICRQDNPDIKVYDSATLNGKRIGVLKRAVRKIERLEKFLDLNNLQCELVYYDDRYAYENCLETKEVDVMLGSDIHIKSYYNAVAHFESDPYYIVTAKNKPELCNQLSAAMELIYAANPSFAAELYDKYFPNRYINSVDLTDEEAAFIAQSSPIRVVMPEDRYPLFYEREGVVQGILPDVLEMITQRTGLTFEYVLSRDYQDHLDLVLRGEADIIGAFRKGEHSSANSDFVCTIPFTTLASVVLCNKSSMGKGENRIMAIPQGLALDASLDSDRIDYYASYLECMEAVNNGSADYTRMPAAFIEDYFSRDYYPQVTLVADTDFEEKISIALPKPVNATLYSILSKALNSFSDEELSGLLENNQLPLYEDVLTLKSLLYTHPSMVIGITAGILLLVCAIIVVVVISRTHARVLRLKLEKAEETSRAKSDFLSKMSHEIRTPMNAIIGLTNLTRMTGEVTPAIDKNLSQIDASAQFLLSLLNEILDMAKIDHQKMRVETAPFDLDQMLDQLECMFAVQSESKGLTLKTIRNVQHSFLLGDELRLQQVLTNLLSNAYKFTDPGGSISLSISELSHTSDTASIHFSVKDTGIGIPQEDLAQIFHAFAQGQNGLKVPGTGLGLSISLKLVELMGGRLQVESQPGAGSEFYFDLTLPICVKPPVQDNQLELPTNLNLDGLRVLLAEDNSINAEIVIELLQEQDVVVDYAANGQEAVELFAQSPPKSYDAILMDINMPVMDGLEAARVIRAMERPDAKTVPILAMTANTFQEDRDNADHAGMTGFLSKPFDVNRLYQILEETLSKPDQKTEISGGK